MRMPGRLRKREERGCRRSRKDTEASYSLSRRRKVSAELTSRTERIARKVYEVVNKGWGGGLKGSDDRDRKTEGE